MMLLSGFTACARRWVCSWRVLGSLALLVLLPAVAGAEMAWISFVTVPPSPFLGSTHAVVVRFYGEQGVFACESYCYEYDDRVDAGSFQLTVNGLSRTSAMTVAQTNYSCNYGPYPGDWMCGWTYEATGNPQLYFNGQTNTLRASVLSWGISDWYEIYVTHQYVTPPTVEIIAGKPGTTIEKDACVAFGIIGDVASECGVLRLTHALPAVRAFGKVRSPTLIYYHDQAQLWAPLRLNILVGPSEQWPDSVWVRVLKPGTSDTLATKRLGGNPSTFAPGQPHRVGVALTISQNDSTRLIPYRLTVAYKRSGAWQDHVTIDGEVAIVNRRNSGFGAGWWLAGLERLYLELTGNRVLWVGGDGSTRVYVPTDSMNPRLFHTTRVDRIDTLVRNVGTSTYTRYLPHGVRVEFDTTGRHTRTVNRLGHVTDFWYAVGSYLPDSLTVPGGLSYTFAYTGGALTTISAPGTVGARVTTLRRDGARVRAIIDPVVVAGRVDSVAFDFFSEEVVQGRTDRRGVRTAFTLETGAPTLATASTPLGGGAFITHTFRTEQALTVGATAGAVHKDSAYTRYDGPRPDVDAVDVTKLWLNGLGAPLKIADALGKVTTIAYDTIWLGHAKSVTRANGFTTTATYDANGNLATTIALDSYGDGRNDSTYYEWDPKWDFLTRRRVVRWAPEGSGELDARFGYDATNGNRLWEEPEAQTARRINYEYYSTGPTAGLLREVVLPGSVRDSVGYDVLGNLAATKTPLGSKTWFSSDAIGRQTLVRTELELSLEQHDSTFYDALGQVIRTVSYGPPRLIGGGQLSAAQAVIAESFYDAEGRLDSLRRVARPDTVEAGVITTRWSYDPLGRRIAEIAPDGLIDSTHYDPAGNAVRTKSRRGHPLTMRYDAMNRLISREVPGVSYPQRAGQGLGALRLWDLDPTSYPWFGTNPATGLPTELPGSEYRDLTIRGDTATFAYDDLGNMIRADNADARIRRNYYRNGQLKTDTLKILSYETRDSTKHVFGNQHHYGVSGFRIKLRHPRQLAPRTAWGIADSSLFQPDGRGGLFKAWDPLGNWFELERNDRYELTRERYDGDIDRRLYYDLDGRLVADTIDNLSGSAFKHPDPKLRATRISYVDASRVGLVENALGIQDTVETRYSGLGHVARLVFRIPARSNYGYNARLYATEWFKTDGLGNRWWTADTTNLSSVTGLRNQVNSFWTRYKPASGAPATGRLVDVRYATKRDVFQYDSSGNLAFQTFDSHPDSLSGSTTLEDHASFYGADDLLRVSEQRRAARNPSQAPDDWPWWMTFEEYRYDALGRRVMVRTRRQCRQDVQSWQAEHVCQLSTIRRTVWDGADEFYEIQRPGTVDNDTLPTQLEPSTVAGFFDPNPKYGIVAYTHALGIDRPISVTRMQYVHKPFYNGQQYGHHVFEPFSIVPHWDWRGTATFGTMADGPWAPEAGVHDGADRICRPAPQSSLCISPIWRTRSFAFIAEAPLDRGWNGTVLDDKEDGTGRLYRRNRSVDPATGRFTQEDPIGFAGGLNLYGFANGDPVNYADPFGLCSVASAVANVAMGAAIARLTGSRYGLGAAALDVASGCIGIGALKNAARLARLSRAARAADDVADVASGGRRFLPFRDAGRVDEINKTLDRIEGGALKYAEDGTVFRNAEGKLPTKSAGYYREYTVDTPGAGNRGARRIVQGRNGETYYTDDHYGTFTQIDPRKH